MGSRPIHRVALPLHSRMASRWNRCRVASEGGVPRRWPWRRPMSLRVEIASGPHPPRDSTTSGMKVMPTEWQAVASRNMTTFAKSQYYDLQAVI